MQDAKRLARGFEATDNARGVQDTFCNSECQIRDFLPFCLYLAPVTLRKLTIF